MVISENRRRALLRTIGRGEVHALSLPAIALETVALPLAVLAVILVVASYTGLWPMDENPYRSYTLQACAWLEGRLDLGMDYPWLELAIVDGKYYVSFPPFPSVVLLPFAAVFGMDTPDHLISLAVTLLGVVYALRLFRRMTGGVQDAMLYVLFLYLGNGYLFIGMQGWVWFIAQTMCFTLSLMALDYAMGGRGGVSLTCWACAVGCRPMVIVYLPLLLHLLYRGWKADHPQGKLVDLLKQKGHWCIAPCAIALFYMALNVARFGNPLEFGHNYLPEFVRAENGQFSLRYAAEHFAQMLRLPKIGGENGALIYDPYDCMAFWLIAPITVSLIGAWLWSAGRSVIFRDKTHVFELAALPLMLFVHLTIICCHKTLGGWQFGNRYIVDMLPYVFYGLLLFKPKGRAFACLNMPLFALGLAVNLIGTVAAYNHWI